MIRIGDVVKFRDASGAPVTRRVEDVEFSDDESNEVVLVFVSDDGGVDPFGRYGIPAAFVEKLYTRRSEK